MSDMDDMDDDDGLKKFAHDPLDDIKPIDQQENEKEPADENSTETTQPRQPTSGAPPFLESDMADTKTPPAKTTPGAPPLPGGPGEPSEDDLQQKPSKPFLQQDEDDFIVEDEDTPRHRLKKGEQVDLTEKDPTMSRLIVAAGWDQRAFEEELVDLDLSLFLLNKDDQTRVDGDFLFYNQIQAADGAVKHLEESRTGAGGGDDERIFIDLNGLPFEILKIAVVISIYDDEDKGNNFSHVKNIYVRLQNNDNGMELVRYEVPEEDIIDTQDTGLYAIFLVREGPRWIVEASGKTLKGGLAKIATDYGIIVKELQAVVDED